MEHFVYMFQYLVGQGGYITELYIRSKQIKSQKGNFVQFNYLFLPPPLNTYA